jgi:hypothetical protein
METSSADDAPQELGHSLPLFLLFSMALACLTCCVMRCCGGYYAYSRGREQDQSEDDGETRHSTLVKSITEAERRKTLMHRFQRNQVTMVKFCNSIFRTEWRPVY